MKTLNSLLILSFLFIFSCTNSSKRDVVEERVEEEPPTVTVAKFVPTDQDREKFIMLKTELKSVAETVENFLAEEGNIGYKEIKYVPNKYLTNLYETMRESETLDAYLTQQKQISRDYKKELNTVGLTAGYSLIDAYGNQKDEVALNNLKGQIRKLIASDIISEPKLIRYKLYEKELNTKMTPAKGAGKTKIEVDGNGKITINGSVIGTAEEMNGELILKPAAFMPE